MTELAERYFVKVEGFVVRGGRYLMKVRSEQVAHAPGPSDHPWQRRGSQRLGARGSHDGEIQLPRSPIMQMRTVSTSLWSDIGV